MPRDLGNLIAPVKSQDARLFDILTEMSSQLSQTKADVADLDKIGVWFPIHLELPVVTVTNNILLSRHSIVLPKFRGESIGQYLKLRYLLITAKVAPGATDFICDILQSQDRGSTFRSLFPSGNANKITLNVGLTLKKYTAFSVDRLDEWDMLRVDGLQTDGSIAGVELLLGAELILD
jgi:hypothetical protein